MRNLLDNLPVGSEADREPFPASLCTLVYCKDGFILYAGSGMGTGWARVSLNLGAKAWGDPRFWNQEVARGFWLAAVAGLQFIEGTRERGFMIALQVATARD